MPVPVADTITSPAAFMRICDVIEFGNDHKGWEKFMAKAAKRFPTYQPIQELAKESMEVVSIYEEEFVVGDKLPSVILPDKLGLPVPTDSRRGKVVLIDFWSTWCPQCIPFSRAKKAARAKFPKDQFEIISIAIDSEKEEWLRVIEAEKYDWLQLIDERMWRGVTVNTLKFDSIPFNFLLSPDGKVVDKAIKPDSLLNSISRALRSQGQTGK
jgi:thiol-disulfide isomerase/thioredoxin